MKDTRNKPYSRTITFATLVLVVVVLKFGKQVLLPFTVAVLFSFLLAPFVLKLQRLRIPKTLSVLIVTLISCAMIGIIGWAIANELVEVAQGLPNYKDTLRTKIQTFNTPIGSNLAKTGETVSELWKEFSKTIAVAPAPPEAARVQVIGPQTSPLEMLQLAVEPFTEAGIVIVSVIFILLKKEDLRDRFIRLLGRGSLHVTTQALNDTALRLSRHLSMLFLVNAGTAIAVALGLFAIGVPNAALWGIFAGVLRFIPFAGIWVAAAFPAILSLAVFNTWWPLVFVAVLFVVLEIAVANFLEPWLYGANTGVSSLALLGSAIFWSWLWGAPGLFVATPLTVCLVVTGKYFPQLRFFLVLLGDEPVLEPVHQFYQRVLGMNPEEAQESFQLFMKENKGLAVYDNLLIPVLVRAQQDFDQGGLDSEQHNAALVCLMQIAGDELGPTNSIETSRRSSILCLPANGKADEMAAELFVKAAAGQNIQTEFSTTHLSEMIHAVEVHSPAVIVISALPPSSIAHARSIIKLLRGRFPDVRIVAGLWNHAGEAAAAESAMKSAGANKVVRSFADGIQQVAELMKVAA